MPFSRRLGFIFIAIGLGSAVSSATLFARLVPEEIPTTTPWWMWLVAVGSWSVGWYLLWAKSSVTLPTISPPIVLGCLLLLFALGVRLYRLEESSQTIFTDEAYTGIEARRLSPQYLPIYMPYQNLTLPNLMGYHALQKIFSETDIIALRLLSVFFGVGSVGLAYGLGSHIYGWRFGFWFAFFLAIMRWTLHFSRLALTGVDSIFFTLLALWLWFEWQKNQRPLALWGFSLSLGAGLWFYMGFRVIALYLIVLGVIHSRQRVKSLIFMGLTLLICFYPLGIYAIQQPDLFWHRTRQLSLTDPINRLGTDVTTSYLHNWERYLSVFHLKGDSNPMLNLANRPLLDPIMGILTGVGLLGMLVALHRRENIFLHLALLGILGLTLAVASATDERQAPQSGRILTAAVPLAFAAAYSLHLMEGQLRSRHYPKWLIYGLEAGVLVAVAGVNLTVYYQQQTRQYEFWRLAQGVDVTRSTLIQTRLQEGYQIWYPHQYDSIMLPFLVPAYETQTTPREIQHLLPLTTPLEQSTAILLDPARGWALDYARYWYPQAQIQLYTTPDLSGAPQPPRAIAWEILLQPADLAAQWGLSDSGCGSLNVPVYGDYQFSEAVWLDGVHLPAYEPLTLAQGLHHFQIQPSQPIPLWKLPQQAYFSPIPRPNLFSRPPLGGLRSQFFAHPYGQPQWERLDPNPSDYLHEVVLNRPYQVVWSGFITFPTEGSYTWFLQTNGDASLEIGGQKVVEIRDGEMVWSAAPSWSAQTYPLKLTLRDKYPYSFLYLRWRTPTNPAASAVPVALLQPSFKHQGQALSCPQ